MKKSFRNQLLIAIGAIWLAAAPFASADVIYMNSTNDLKVRFEPGTLQVGDEIVLAGSMRWLTNFSFEWWGTNAGGGSLFAGAPKVEVRFYKNNGPLFNGYTTPGDMFWYSGLVSLGSATTERSALVFSTTYGDFSLPGYYMPVVSNFTWSVTFSGMGSGDHVGVDLYSPPTVGQNYPDYWQYSGSAWELKTNSLVTAMSFGAVFEAGIPEPSSLALGLLGAGGLLMTLRRQRRK